jgi:hypothetical protein
MLTNEEMKNAVPVRQEGWSDEDMCLWMGRFVERELAKKNAALIQALTDISNMCIGKLAMGYSLDAQSIGEMIYESTGMTNPQLNDYMKTLDS